MKIGWVGTGIMGLPMCTNLINGGHILNVFSRTREKTYSLIKKGAIWYESPGKLTKSSEIIFVMVGYPGDVKEIFFGDDGLLHNSSAGTTIVDMTTSSPELAKTIYKEANSKGIFSLDAPVSGGDIGAKSGKLAIMVGGDKKIYEKYLHLFKLLGSNVSYMGNSGSGQHTKISNQILVAGTMIGVVESLIYAKKAGVGINEVIDIIGKGAASSWSINTLGRKIANRDFNPGFFIKHFVKDMKIALDEADRMFLPLPGLALAKQFYVLAIARGYENLGTQAIYKVLEDMNKN